MTTPKLITLTILLTVTANYAVAQDEGAWASDAETTFTPSIHHSNIADITLFAQNPDIVTPIGIAVSPDGRVFVQECHTHKRDSDYGGPESDRILVFDDTDNDGIADRRSVFYEGLAFSTDLLFGPDGHLYVSTRSFLGRFRDAATQQQADGDPEILVICETNGNYPHNGVGGLAIDSANPEWLAFGFGENLGFDYTFVGTDGVRLSGGGEGGTTYRCRLDGSMLTRQTTGHWNAFGMTYDLDGNLFSTDNDPNSTPPNRLLHIVPGGDYGFEYRYGRSGRHPLVCWHGEHPGTLGMIGALGEAACGVIAYGNENLLSASWTDNRIDIHSLEQKGASFVATREPFVSGPDDFRPVHFSYSDDGKYLYFTDWVNLSYPVHGQGRIWRIELKESVRLEPLARDTESTRLSPENALAHLGSIDPYVRTEAMNVLIEHPDVLRIFDFQNEANAIARAHYAVTLKRLDVEDSSIIPQLLSDNESMVRFVGIKWIADQGLEKYRPNLVDLLGRPDLNRQDLRAVVAALAEISGDSNREFSPEGTMLDIALDESRPFSLRAMALQNVNVDHERLTIETLAALTRSSNPELRSEAIRSLSLHMDSAKGIVLAEIAANTLLEADSRADAIAGLASQADTHTTLLEALANDDNSIVSDEAVRTLVSAGLADREIQTKPPVDDVEGWQSLLDDASGEANTAVGRRLFFHSKLGGCYKCHAMNGRGHDIGPDLTDIRHQSGITPDWLLEHIVNPNSAMAPYYRPQLLVTIDGKVQTGLVIGQEGQSQAYVDSDGNIFYVDKEDIEERREVTTSIMPNGLVDLMDANEIRDLIAFLLQGGDS